MTDFDKGAFVAGRAITIEPAANGTFIVWRGRDEDHPRNHLMREAIAFSSASDLIKFLNAEYLHVADKREPGSLADIAASLGVVEDGA